MIKKIVFGLALLAGVNFFTSCSGCSSNNAENLDEIPDSVANAPLQLSENVVNDMIQNISSPVEMATSIKNSGAGFSEKVLNPSDNMKNYNSSFKRALNLGVYSADLGYINTFNKNTVVVQYLLAVKELADGINVGQFLDFSTLKRLATNATNLDSLKQLSVTSFNKMDRYLREQKRANTSTAIIAGAWIEGIHITCDVVEQTKDEDLTNRLAEQKEIVSILLLVLDNYSKADKNFQALCQKIEAVKKAYENVRITYEFGEPITKVNDDGMLVIEQNEIPHYEFTPDKETVINNIIESVRSVRQFVIE